MFLFFVQDEVNGGRFRGSNEKEEILIERVIIYF